MSLLQDRNADGHVIGSPVILTEIVPQVLFFDVPEQLSVVGSQMAAHKRILSIVVIFYNLIWKHS